MKHNVTGFFGQLVNAPAHGLSLKNSGFSLPPALVFANSYCLSWPPDPPPGKGPAKSPRPARYLPAEEAFFARYHSDAHFVAYHCEEFSYRLNKRAVQHTAVGMVWLCIDVDCTEAKRAKTPAPDSWWAAELEKVHALNEAHPGVFAYRTRGGYRLVYALEKPRAVEGKGEEWKAYYLGTLAYLEERFGIVGDTACCDWTRLFRLPYVVRKPREPRENREIFGGLGGVWSYEPPAQEPAPPKKIAKEKIKGKSTRPPPRADMPVDAFLLGRAFGYAGMLGGFLGQKWAVRCPWESQHNSGEPYNSSTVLFAPNAECPRGKFHCSHTACAGHRKYGDVLAKLPAEAVARAEQELRDKTHALVSAEAAARVTRDAIAAAFDALAGIFSLIRPTAGTGKTTCMLDLVASRDEIATLFLPTHRLAAEQQALLQTRSTNTKRPRGLTVLKDDNGNHVCKFPDAADDIAKNGERPREVLCSLCPHRENYAGTGEDCRAYADTDTGDAKVSLLMHAIAADVMHGMAKRLIEKEENAPSLVVIDEALPLTESAPLCAKLLQTYGRLRTQLSTDTYERMDPIVTVLRRAFESGELKDGATLRDILKDDLITIQDAKDLATVQWRNGYVSGLAFEVSKGNPEAAKKLREMAEVKRVLDCLLEAAHAPLLPLVFACEGEDLASPFTIRTRHPWARAATAFCAAGGRVVMLDATGSKAHLEAAGIPNVTEYTVHAADAVNVTRTFLKFSSGSRKRLLCGGKVVVEEIRGILRRLARELRAKKARSALFVTYKPVAEQWDLAWSPELKALVEEGMRLDVIHYGAVRGLDCFADRDALATIGHSWGNLQDDQDAARVLGLDAKEFVHDSAMAEMVQAWGRARPVFGETPKHILHAGPTRPDLDWAPQWAACVVDYADAGRPKEHAWTAETLSADRRDGEGRKGHAARLGLDWRSYRRLEGGGVIPIIKEEREIPLDGIMPPPVTPPKWLPNESPPSTPVAQSGLVVGELEELEAVPPTPLPIELEAHAVGEAVATATLTPVPPPEVPAEPEEGPLSPATPEAMAFWRSMGFASGRVRALPATLTLVTPNETPPDPEQREAG